MLTSVRSLRGRGGGGPRFSASVTSTARRLSAQPFAQPVEGPGTARHFSLVQVAPLAQSFAKGVQPRHLVAAQALLFGGGQAPQGLHESCIRLNSSFEAKSPGDAGERAALLPERHHLAVTPGIDRRRGRAGSSEVFSRARAARRPTASVARAGRQSGLTRLACKPLGPCSASKSTFCPSASSR